MDKQYIINLIETMLDTLHHAGCQCISITVDELESILELIKNQEKEIGLLWDNIQWLRGTGIKPM